MASPDPRLEEFKADNLSKQCVFSNSVKLTFNADYPYCFVMPKITNAVMEEYFEGYLDNMPKDLNGAYDLDEYADNLSQNFEQSDSFFDWEQSFEPHTSWFYPVPLKGKKPSELETIATNIYEWSGNVILLECDGEYYLTFNASGMDLNWDMAAAFIACGFIPPYAVLSNLSAFHSKGKYCSTLGNTESSLVLQSVLECAVLLSFKADLLVESLKRLTN